MLQHIHKQKVDEINEKLAENKLIHDGLVRALNDGDPAVSILDLRRVEEVICWLEHDLEQVEKESSQMEFTPTERCFRSSQEDMF